MAGIPFVAYQQHRAAKQYRAHRAEYCSALTVPSEQKKACEEEGTSAKDYLPWWYELITWPGGVETWAIIGTGVVIGWQGYETRKAAEAARIAGEHALTQATAAVNAARARILFRVEHPTAEQHERGEIVVLARNYGATPGEIIKVAWGYLILLPSIMPPLDAEMNGFGGESTHPRWIAKEYEPPLGIVHRFSIQTVFRSQWAEIRSSRSVFWVFGYVKYRDGISSKERESRFCYKWNISGFGLMQGGPQEWHVHT